MESDELLSCIAESPEEAGILGVFIQTESRRNSLKTIDPNLTILHSIELPVNQDEVQAVFAGEDGARVLSDKKLYTVSSGEVVSEDAEAWYRSGGLDTENSYYAAINRRNAENGFFRSVFENDDGDCQTAFFAVYQGDRLEIQRVRPYENAICADVSKSGEKLLVCGKSGEITVFRWS